MNGCPTHRAALIFESLILCVRDVWEHANPVAASVFAAVSSGHSHKPSRDVRDGVLYFNPGRRVARVSAHLDSVSRTRGCPG